MNRISGRTISQSIPVIRNQLVSYIVLLSSNSLISDPSLWRGRGQTPILHKRASIALSYNNKLDKFLHKFLDR
jgi:hypothetical protein